MIGLTPITGALGLFERRANSWNREDRADAGDRIARANDDRLGAVNRVEHPRRRLGLFRAGEADGKSLQARQRSLTKNS